MRWNRAVALVAVVLAVSGCGRRAARPEGGEVPAPVGTAPVVADQEAGRGTFVAAQVVAPAGAGRAAGAAQGGSLDALWAAQKLIRDGRIEVEVDDVEATLARVGEIAATRHALVAGSELRKDASGRSTGTLTLKVPAGSFDPVFADLREIGRVRSESTTTEDVTKQYTDLELRLDVKRRARERLEALLATRGGELDELLQVERELERVVGEIESLEGEKRYFDQRIAVSTLVLVLYEPGSVAPRPGALEPIREAVRDALTVLSQSLAFLIYVLTAALPWLLLAWLLWRLVRRLRRRRAARAAG